jgi:hypothetical protein
MAALKEEALNDFRLDKTLSEKSVELLDDLKKQANPMQQFRLGEIIKAVKGEKYELGIANTDQEKAFKKVVGELEPPPLMPELDIDSPPATKAAWPEAPDSVGSPPNSMALPPEEDYMPPPEKGQDRRHLPPEQKDDQIGQMAHKPKKTLRFATDVQEAFIDSDGTVKRSKSGPLREEKGREEKGQNPPLSKFQWRKDEDKILESDYKALGQQKQQQNPAQLTPEEILEDRLTRLKQAQRKKTPASGSGDQTLYKQLQADERRYKKELSNISELAKKTTENTKNSSSKEFNNKEEKKAYIKALADQTELLKALADHTKKFSPQKLSEMQTFLENEKLPNRRLPTDGAIVSQKTGFLDGKSDYTVNLKALKTLLDKQPEGLKATLKQEINSALDERRKVTSGQITQNMIQGFSSAVETSGERRPPPGVGKATAERNKPNAPSR